MFPVLFLPFLKYCFTVLPVTFTIFQYTIAKVNGIGVLLIFFSNINTVPILY